MNIRYSIIFLIFVSISVFCSARELNNKPQIVDLQEFVIEGQNLTLKGDTLVAIPTKQEKNHATDLPSLIERMSIPILRVNDNIITGTNGQEVAIYVNGKPATDIDLSTFWPKDAIRVEYIQNDLKSTSMGPTLNIVMHQYKSGGLTKLNINQNTAIQGNIEIASKFVINNFSVMANIRSGYSKKHDIHSEGSESFVDITHNSSEYDIISNNFNETQSSKGITANAGISVEYVYNNRNIISHNIYFDGEWTPNITTTRNAIWDPNLFPRYESRNEIIKSSRIPRISGNYRLIFNDKIGIWAKWNYIHADNRSTNIFNNSEQLSFSNTANEQINSLHANLTLKYVIRNNLAAAINLETFCNFYHSKYISKYPAHFDIIDNSNNIQLDFIWKPTEHLWVSVIPTCNVNYRNNNHYCETNFYPGVSSNIGFDFKNRYSLNFFSSFAVYPLSIKNVSDVLLQQSEFIWIKGNPHLKPRRDIHISLNAQCYPLNWLSFIPTVSYSKTFNEVVETYNPITTNSEEIVREYLNSKSQLISLSLPIFIKLFRNRLSINIQPQLTMYKFSKSDHSFHEYFGLRGNVAYYIKNFSFAICYENRKTIPSNGGSLITKIHNSWTINAGYSNGNLNISLSVSNPFIKYHIIESNLNTSHYLNSDKKFNIGRCFGISVFYTFGYGKKINPDIEIEKINNTESSILN